MNFSPEAIAVISGLGGTVVAIGSAFYRHLLKQIEQCTAAKATLETEAKDAVKAEKQEKEEWRRLALEPRDQR